LNVSHVVQTVQNALMGHARHVRMALSINKATVYLHAHKDFI